MRFLVMVKATKESEAGELPTAAMLARMGKFNEGLVRDGVMLTGEGLQATSKGARMKFGSGEPRVTDGPFTETKELVAGFWIWQCKSKEEAVEWLSRAPFEDAVVEIRRIVELEEFAPDAAAKRRANETH
jgi:hypothetical protein